jgi:flagellar biosynthesis protein FliQ
MGVTETVTAINQNTLLYAPQALSAITAIESAAAALPGVTKKQIAVNVIQASAKVAEGIPVPSVAAIGLLVDLFVSILNATGIFRKKTAPALEQ